MIGTKGQSQRRFLGIYAGVIFFAGCTSVFSPSPVYFAESSSQNFIGTGKVLLSQPGQNHSGELSLFFAENRQLRLQIFTPLVGTLIYEVRANIQKLMILDYREGWYVLETNTEQSRRRWLGMDLSIEELSWLLQGRENFWKEGEWRVVSQTPERLQLRKGKIEMKILFDSHGRIRHLEKLIEELPEYELEISKYQEGAGKLTPKRLKFSDSSGTHKLLFVFSDVRRPSAFKQSLSFKVPESLSHYRHEK